MFKNVQTIFEYKLQTWSEKETAILDLASLASRVGNLDNKNGIWYFISVIAEMITDEKDRPNEFSFLDFEKSVIGLLDSDLISAFVNLYKELDTFISKEERTNKEKLVNQNLSEVDKKKIDSLYLSSEQKNRWSVVLGSISSEVREDIWLKINELLKYDEDLYYQLANIGAVIGLYPTYNLYSLEEVKSLLVEGGREYSLLRLLRSLSEYMRDENGYDLSLIVIDLLKTQFYFEKNDYSWDDAIVLTMLLFVVFNKFSELTDEQQVMLTQYYLVRALLLGIDVREKIQNVLYNTNFVIDYTVASMDFYQALGNNQEKVIVNTNDLSTKLLSELFKNYLALSGQDFLNGYKVAKFIDDIYNGQKYRDIFIKWLQEIFYIFIHLKNADLIERNKGSELTEEEIYQNEMTLLVANFMIGEDGADFITNYFLKPDKEVPVYSFLRELSQTVNLEDDLIIKNISILSDILHKNKLLDNDTEIIIFNEETGKFEFNEKLKV